MDLTNLYLGQGIIFPFVLNDGTITISDYEMTIDSAIKSILSWEYGSRFFQPEYGSKIWQVLGMPNEALTQALVRRYIIDALSSWEDRITLLETTITMPKTYTIDITLRYLINATKKVSEVNLKYIG